MLDGLVLMHEAYIVFGLEASQTFVFKNTVDDCDVYIVFSPKAIQAFVVKNRWCLPLVDGGVIERVVYIVFGPEAKESFVVKNMWCLALLYVSYCRISSNHDQTSRCSEK